MFLLLSKPLYTSSRSTIFVPVFLPHERQRTTLPMKMLKEKDPLSTDIWSSNIIDHYISRPSNSEIWNQMTLYEIAIWFQLSTDKQTTGVDNDIPLENADATIEDLDSTDQPQESSNKFMENPLWRQGHDNAPFIPLPNSKFKKQPRWRLTGPQNRTIQLRKRPKCISAPIGCKSELTSRYATLALHVPFRNEYQDLLQVEPGSEVTDDLVDSALGCCTYQIYP
jgi:hypothetical protein